VGPKGVGGAEEGAVDTQAVGSRLDHQLWLVGHDGATVDGGVDGAYSGEMLQLGVEVVSPESE
jgi:hypothetical protein